jgi:citrate lyase subunit beta/citryl-CoA lyase
MKTTVLLFVPGDRPERYAKAVASGADAAIVDLEDAVAPDKKPYARLEAQKAFTAGLDATLRINPPATEFGQADIAAFAGLHPRAVLVPKVESVEDLKAVRIDAPLIALIESVRGLRNIDEIAGFDKVIALDFGAFDLCAELGAQPTPEVLAPYRSMVVMAARLAHKLAHDAPFLGIGDEPGLRAESERAVAYGFDGKLAIHPSQVATIRAAFTPTDADVRHARAVLAAVEQGGVAVVDGKMVDPPLVASARRVLARAEPAGSGAQR